MTKNVLISIAGLRYDATEEDVVEVISRGEYYYKNGKHYAIYDEVSEELPNIPTKCIMKMASNKIEIIKNGESNVHMVFEINQSNYTCYTTPFGELMLGIRTQSISIEESTDQITINLRYQLDINYEYASDCDLKIKITEKN